MASINYIFVTLVILLSSIFCSSYSSIVQSRNIKSGIHRRSKIQKNGSFQPSILERNGKKLPVLRSRADQQSIFDQFLKKNPDKLKSMSEKIVGGHNAPRNMAKYLGLVLTFIDGQEYPNACSGVVIGKTRVLTTAHCFGDEDLNMNNVAAVAVLVGLEDLVNDITNDYELLFFAYQVHIEPNYSPRFLKNDIGIITMDMELENGYPIAKIPEKPLAINETVWAAGYGRTASGDGEEGLPDHVQEVELRHRTFQLCKKLEDKRYKAMADRQTMICASSPVIKKGGKDTCGGDSGGPLYKKNEKGQMFVFGLTSWGDLECGRPNRGSWYTKVRRYRKKINRHIKVRDELAKISRNDWTRIF